MRPRSFRSSGRRGAHGVAILLGLLALLSLSAVTAWTDISVTIYPPQICTQAGEEFTVYIYIDSAGSAFDGYETVVHVDPAMLEFLALEEDGMLLEELCGNTWWHLDPDDPSEADSTMFISHVALCGGESLTGPGPLSSITFRVLSGKEFDPVGEIHFDYIDFFRAGLNAGPVEARDGHVVVVEDPGECFGACCLEDDTCLPASFEECEDLAGDFLGYLISCDPNPCGAQGIAAPESPADRQDYLSSRGILIQPTPNPFSEEISFEIVLPSQGALAEVPIALMICDAAGRAVRRLCPHLEGPRSGTVRWDGRDDAGQLLPPGAYFCRLDAGGETRALRLILLR